MNEKIKWIGGFLVYPIKWICEILYDRLRLLISIEFNLIMLITGLSCFLFSVLLLLTYIIYMIGNYGNQMNTQIITIFWDDKFLLNCVALFVLFSVAQTCIWLSKLDKFLERKNLKFKSNLK